MSDAYQALYRKWRPTVFEDVVGQEHISETLKNSVISGRIAHAYLFCGTRGTGKTSTAKIFSRSVNCTESVDGNPCNCCDTCRGIIDGSILDVYEMDAASNSGIDSIREIRDEVNYAPAGCKYKVYIVDEAHMLTTEAFNALLKTLEEPPAHVIFILATTEPHKLPATILSRCQRFDFKRIGAETIAARMKKIVASEEIAITPDALELVSELADGSMRDGLSILDQCAAYSDGELRYDDITEIVGVADRRVLFDVAKTIADGNSGEALKIADDLLGKGKDALNFFEELITHFRALMICKSTSDAKSVLDRSEETIARYNEQAADFSVDKLLYIISELSDFLLLAKKMSAPKVAVEMAVVKLCMPVGGENTEELALRIEKLEGELAELKRNGVPAQSRGGARATAAEARAEELEKSPAKAAEPHVENSVEWDKWREALNLIKKESKSLYTFLFNAKALYFGDEIELVLTGDLAYEKINTPEGKRYLSDLFTSVQGAELKTVVSKKGNLKSRDGGGGASIADIAAKKDLLGDKMTVIDNE